MRRLLFLLVFLFTAYTAAVYVWAAGDKPEPSVPYTESVAGGAALWRSYNCQGCHQLYGLGGYMGPDLTNVARYRGQDYMRAFIRNGSQRMPNFYLSQEAVQQLTDYLTWIDATGLSLPPKQSIHWSGTYQISQR